MSKERKPREIFEDTDGSYCQRQGNTIKRIFTPVQVAAIKQIMKDNSEEVEKKHYVKVFDNEFGYLNINISTGRLTAGSMCETEFLKTKFTNKAIEQLKQRDDIPLDWDKVELEEEK